jgi:hypothetical protein
MHYTRNRTDEKPLAFYVPVNLDPTVIRKGQRQLAAFFLNLLHWRWCCWQADANGWIRLKQEYITRVIPPDVWPALRDRLIGRRIVQHKDLWTPGKCCMGYRVAPEYRKTKRIECTDPELAERIRQVYASESVPLLPVHRWLLDKLEHLDFDLERAERIISTMEPDADSPMPVDEYRDLLIGTAQRLADRDHRLTCDRFGRVHTVVTRLAKELRCCLRVDGQPLIGLDLGNSQPLIAGVVARQYYRSNMTAMRLRDRVFSDHGRPYHLRTPDRTEPDPKRPDLEQYIETCEAGRLYESLMGPSDDRDRAKTRFLTTMYDRNRKGNRALSPYPSVEKMLTALKRKDYRHAAHLMQNCEACLFIGTIAERLRAESPDLPVYTIHDSILTVPAGVEHVRATILNVFGRLDIHPTLKTEHYE